jgi:hypothetical protein
MPAKPAPAERRLSIRALFAKRSLQPKASPARMKPAGESSASTTASGIREAYFLGQ